MEPLLANLSSEYEFFAQWLSAAISCSLLLISLVRKVMENLRKIMEIGIF